jgi:hypothetical protein
MTKDVGLGIFLGVALTLSISTKLRLMGLPLGFGELMIFLFIVFVYTTKKITFNYNDIIFVIAFYFISFLGAGAAIYWNSFHVEHFLHYMFSFSFAIIFYHSLKFLLSSDFKSSIVTSSFVMTSVFLLLVLYSGSFIYKDLFYYGGGGGRFSGLSKNPNQLALLLAFIPFLVCRLKVVFLFKACILIAIIAISYSTKSDALYISVSIACIVACGALLFKRSGLYVKFFAISVASIVSLLLISYVFTYFFFLYDSLNQEGGQADVRINLWVNGLIAFLYSPLFGLGPGAHSGIISPMSGSEVHNSFIDMLTMFGVFSCFLYYYLFDIVKKLYKGSEYCLLGALVSILVFSMFHMTLRHPLFWCVILFCQFYGSPNSRLKKCAV